MNVATTNVSRANVSRANVTAIDAGANGKIESINNRLVHINLSIQADEQGEISSIMMRERPFVGELNLDIDPDNLSFLIAVGDVTGAAQPLAVSRITCIGKLAILWLDLDRWLVLPPTGSHLSVRQTLENTFGQDIQFKGEGDEMQAELTEAAVRYLLESENTQDTHRQADRRRLDSHKRLVEEGVKIQSPSDQQDYDILVRDICAERLWQWMAQNDAGQAVNG